MKEAPISASSVATITLVGILVMDWMAPFGLGLGNVSQRKRCPPAWVWALLTYRHDTLLWNHKIMSLDLYHMVVYECVVVYLSIHTKYSIVSLVSVDWSGAMYPRATSIVEYTADT